MGTLYVTEFAATGRSGGSIPVAHSIPIINNNVSIGGVSTASNPFQTNTTIIRVHTDSICSVRISVGTSIVAATTADARMATNQTEYFSVMAGEVISVIVNI